MFSNRNHLATLLLVSHDRDLLNNVVDKIIHLHDCKFTVYTGGYDTFEDTRRERLASPETDLPNVN